MSDKPRVLIAAESRIVRTKLAQAIRDRFDVREAVDGEAAWQALLLDSSIRLALVGLTMPKLDGIELIGRLRASKSQRARELPAVVIAGSDEREHRDRALAVGATDAIDPDIAAAELTPRLDVLIKLSTTREALAESRSALESARTVDPETSLLQPAFFDRQLERMVSYCRRHVTDVAVVSVCVDISLPQATAWELEIEQRARLLGRSLAAAIRLEDLATRPQPLEFCVAAQSDGLSGALGLAGRLRKILENVDAGAGVEIWTFIGVACLSEDMRAGAEQLRQISQKRAQQAQAARSRRIVVGAGDGAAADNKGRADAGSMDISLALALIRAGREAEVVPHLPRLLHQIRPLLALVRRQKENAQSKEETVAHGNLQGVPRTLD